MLPKWLLCHGAAEGFEEFDRLAGEGGAVLHKRLLGAEEGFLVGQHLKVIAFYRFEKWLFEKWRGNVHGT